ncbi:hypothetical protein EWH99_05845 [Sporolactobacillus sp. THM7-7]|nr:hypothetical protein EWH99_05845 [Sporolactobacillus sp. THM7-7]
MNLVLSILTLVGLSLLQSLISVAFILAIFYLIGKWFHKSEEKWRVFFKKHAFARLMSIFISGYLLSSIVIVGAGYGLFSITHTEHAVAFSIVPVAVALPSFIKLVRNRENIQKSFVQSAAPDSHA